ncbi:MAG: SDR family oxidoreductase [Caldilineaceae bacterium]
MYDYTGKVVIVTGGAKGIGRGISLAFAEAGANVLAADVDVAAGQQLEKDGAALKGELRFREADIAKAVPCRELVETAVSYWGGVDVVCNNAGIQPPNSYLPADEFPEELWDRIMDVNVKSRFLMTKYCVPEMRKRGGGVILNTASVQGLQSANHVPAYAASKGADLSLTRQLALDFAKDNIRVLAVNPGTIDTPLVAEAAQAMGLTVDDLRGEWAAAHPIGRIGTPADIAKAMLFLASDDASFMTGSYVNVDGGLMAKGAWA